MSETRLVAILVGVLLTCGGGWYLHHSGYNQGDTAGSSRVQLEWDQNKADIQRIADEALVTATKQRDDAIQANQVLHDQFLKDQAAAAADTAQFAARLRNAESIIAASGRSVPAGGAGQSDVPSGGTSSAQQLGSLVTLVAELRRECKANDDALDAIYASVDKQPHVFQ